MSKEIKTRKQIIELEIQELEKKVQFLEQQRILEDTRTGRYFIQNEISLVDNMIMDRKKELEDE